MNEERYYELLCKAEDRALKAEAEQKETAQMLCDEHYKRLMSDAARLKAEEALREIDQHCSEGPVITPRLQQIQAIVRAALPKNDAATFPHTHPEKFEVDPDQST